MTDRPKKLVTWKHWILILSAAAVGTSSSLFREYLDTGSAQPSRIVTSVVAFCFCLLIMAAFSWYANRPESEDKQ